MNSFSAALDDFLQAAMAVKVGSSQQFSKEILPTDESENRNWKQAVRYLESQGRVVSVATEHCKTGVFCADGVDAHGNLIGWGIENQTPLLVLVQNIGLPFHSLCPVAPNTTEQGLKLKPHHTMAVLVGTKKNGWGNVMYIPSGAFSLMIADTSGIQYGQSAFEGACAMRNKNDDIFAFRIDQNAQRFITSIASLDLPTPEFSAIHDAILKTIAYNKAYVPAYGHGKLYIRPSVCGLSGGLGIIVPDVFLITIEVAAFGDYLPPSIRVEARIDIARPSTGSNKIAPNYGGSYRIKHGVKARGFDDYLSFDASGNAEEVATCAAGFLDHNGVYIFPPVRDEIDQKPRNILPSITRKSTIELLQSMGKSIEIRDVHHSELSSMQCMFTMGNAVGVLYVSEICLKTDENDEGEKIIYASDTAKKEIIALKDAIYSARVGEFAGKEDWVQKIQ